MAGLSLTQIRKTYGKVEVIKGVDLEIEHGEFVVFVGPSGCGKSTLLRMIAGLEDITGGELKIGDKVVNGVQPRDRGVAMVFQSYALYPHMSVYDNVGFGLRLKKTPKDERDAKIREAARILQMEHLLDRKPAQLSGGQRQRVAIGRAIVRQPEVFLFDEPLSNLDASLRMDMRMEISKLHRDLGATMIYVTHDQVEAMTLADKIVVLQAGRIEQVGSPRELYERPDNLFVAQFIGSPKMNVLPCSVEKSLFSLQGHGGGHYPHADAPQKPVKLGIRPEHMSVVGPEEGHCAGTVEVAEYLGADTFLYVALDGLDTVQVRISGSDTVEEGARVGLRFDETRMHFFDADDQAIR